MSNKPILFYSPNCSHSIDLWKKLKKSNMLEKILKVNVTKTNSIPNNVTRTPTLLVDGRKPLVGQAIEFYLRSPQAQVSTQPNQSSQVNRMEDNSSIRDYMPGEMGSAWSDNYSFIDNNNPIDHSFQWLNKNSTIECSKPMAANKKANIIDSRLETLKRERENVVFKN